MKPREIIREYDRLRQELGALVTDAWLCAEVPLVGTCRDKLVTGSLVAVIECGIRFYETAIVFYRVSFSDGREKDRISYRDILDDWDVDAKSWRMLAERREHFDRWLRGEEPEMQPPEPEAETK